MNARPKIWFHKQQWALSCNDWATVAYSNDDPVARSYNPTEPLLKFSYLSLHEKSQLGRRWKRWKDQIKARIGEKSYTMILLVILNWVRYDSVARRCESDLNLRVFNGMEFERLEILRRWLRIWLPYLHRVVRQTFQGDRFLYRLLGWMQPVHSKRRNTSYYPACHTRKQWPSVTNSGLSLNVAVMFHFVSCLQKYESSKFWGEFASELGTSEPVSNKFN